MQKWPHGYLVGAAMILGCGQSPPPTPPPLCGHSFVPEAEDVDESAPLPTMTPSQWRELLVGATGSDCTGTTIAPPGAGPRCERDSTRWNRLEVTDASVMVRRVDSRRRLVHVRTHENGTEILGLVALAKVNHREVRIERIGHIASHSERLRLSLEDFGANELLVVDSEYCESAEGEESTPDDCQRDVRFALPEGDHWRQVSVYDDEGHCDGPARLAIYATEDIDVDGTTRRSFRLATDWEVQGTAVVIREQVNVEDRRLDALDLPATPYRVVNSTRRWTRGPDGWTTSDGALWDRIHARHGATTVHRDEEN